MKKKLLIFLLIILVAGYIGLFVLNKQSSDEQTIELVFPDCQKKYFAKVADTPVKRAIGFSNKTKIMEDEAIIFIFDEERILHFWMKDTYVPLDIIFLDENKKVVNFFNMTPCLEKNCPIYSSLKKAKYAIEIKSGSLSCLKNGMEVKFDLDN